MPNLKPSTQGKKLLTTIAWLLFLGGLFGSLVTFVKITKHLPPSEYTGLAIVTCLWLLSSAAVVFTRSRI